jgi:hypothetical protein
LLGNFVHSNKGPGVTIHAPATPRLVGNRISGMRIDPNAHPILLDNLQSRDRDGVGR